MLLQWSNDLAVKEKYAQDRANAFDLNGHGFLK